MIRLIIILLISFTIGTVNSQDTINSGKLQKYFYPNGKLSSEGILRDGKPDGYWKTYDDNGNLISEGNRKNFMLDGEWKFYNGEGNISMKVNYKEDKKSGFRTTYLPEVIMVDSFENDRKNNWNSVLFLNGNPKIRTFYVNGVEDGWAYQYAEDGRIIIKTFYNNGFIRSREYINGLNSSGNKQGLWKEFYEDGTTKMAGTYRDGIKDGYFKFYDVNGNLTHIQKYRNGIIEDEPAELAKLEIRTDYYEDGSIKLVGSYKDGMAEGTRREYDRSGKITDSYLMHRGIIVGHGIIDEAGKKQGDWEIFYDNGRLRGKGKYIDNRLVGIWTYYFENGKIEQTGSFDDKGEYTGDWKWYYEDGSLRIVEQYFEGEREGDFVEYDQLGEIMVEGSYVNGLKEGNWTTNVNGYIEVGSYLENVRDGDWKYYYAKDTLYFEGRFLDGSEDGTHTWYYRNGKTQKTGNYIMSLKNGDWKYYSEEGLLLLKIRFKDGIEKDYDNVRIEPEMELKDMEE